MPKERIDINIIKNYYNLQDKLPLILESYGVSQKHVYSEIGMHRSTWTYKLKHKTFSTREMTAIALVLNK